MRSDTFVIDGNEYRPTSEQWEQIEDAWSTFLETAKQAYEKRRTGREQERAPIYLDGGRSQNAEHMKAFYDRVRDILTSIQASDE